MPEVRAFKGSSKTMMKECGGSVVFKVFFICVYFIHTMARIQLSFHAQTYFQPPCQLFPHQSTYFVHNCHSFGFGMFVSTRTCIRVLIKQSTYVTRIMYHYGGFCIVSNDARQSSSDAGQLSRHDTHAFAMKIDVNLDVRWTYPNRSSKS